MEEAALGMNITDLGLEIKGTSLSKGRNDWRMDLTRGMHVLMPWARQAFTPVALPERYASKRDTSRGLDPGRVREWDGSASRL